LPEATRWQPRQARHGLAAGSGAEHRSPAARSRASVVLPTEPGPESTTACGARPRIIDAISAVARGWPRVAAFFMAGVAPAGWCRAGYSPAPSPEPELVVAAVAAGLRRAGARFLGAGASLPASAFGAASALGAGSLPSAAAVAAGAVRRLRLGRRVSLAAGAASDESPPVEPVSVAAGLVGLAESWARKSSSISGGTSLHGSLESRGGRTIPPRCGCCWRTGRSSR